MAVIIVILKVYLQKIYIIVANIVGCGILYEVSIKELNRYYLLKNHLLHKANFSDCVNVVRDLCGLQAQMKSTIFFALFSRVKGITPDIVDKLLYEEKALTRTYCMRGTIHVIPSEDLPLYISATKGSWKNRLKRRIKKGRAFPLEKIKREVYPRVLKALENESLSKKQISLFLGSKEFKDISIYSVIKSMCYDGLIVFGKPKGNESMIAKATEWFSGTFPNVDESTAKIQLLEKYLKTYGPASIQDFAYWIGSRVSDAKYWFEKLSDKTVPITVKKTKSKLFALKETKVELMKVDCNTKVPFRFLPYFDSALLGHKNKDRILEQQYKRKVFLPAANVAAVVLSNGFVKGIWRYKITKKKLAITINFFEKMDSDELDEAYREADQLKSALGVPELEVVFD